MRIFVTGASGWVGSAVVPELIGAGHEVLGLARSDASAGTVAARGAEVVRGGLDDLDTLRAAATGSDGVVHLAFGHDFSRFDASVQADARAVETLGAALEGTGKPLAVASGTPALPGRVATERDHPEYPPGSPAAGRAANARATLDLASRGVRSSVVGLPRTVHGEGDKGFVAWLVAGAREKGVAGYVGDGSNRWPAVHLSDAGRLFRLAVEQAPAGSMLHAVGDEGVPIRDIAEVVGRHLGLPTAARPAEEFGFLGGILSLDQPASAAVTGELLGWRPVGPGLIEDLDKGHYFTGGSGAGSR
ncbi:SDR family oxidoreductase [Streptomyces sp. TS71-3]|uniref:SDR family oxidoreductase n=1 Tax=Streptomyces sp. TS71-3 TaxID=2733862 RepID=UPI001B2B7FB1|nr:SDR family oxidoreductase [Streptomyces sp. TS71-3]GHJ37974.1 3-beta hydroxysteroid dehydrogenase [Streptomyces sp. TS71-3]